MSVRAQLSLLLLICLALATTAESAGKRRGTTIGLMGGMSVKRTSTYSSYSVTGRADTQQNIDRILRAGTPLNGPGWEPIQVSGGGFLNFSISEKLGLQPELLYIRDRIGSYSGNIVVGYLDVPLLLTYTPLVPSRFTPSIMAGVYTGFSVTSKFENQSKGQSYPSISGSTSERIAPSSTNIPFRMTYGVILGGGVGMATGNGSVILNARYLLGKTRVTQSGYPASTDNSGMLQLFAGYSFRLP
ncbi:MAG: outer membrane beta-barrel protein [Candidatus Zixiibacteriota bacterium]